MPKPSLNWLLPIALPLLLWRPACGAPDDTGSAPAQYLSDCPELILSSQQAWGELGCDTAAHQAGQPGRPLQIGNRLYAKGLGHHANGAITVALDGQFAAFYAEVGLQPCGGGSSVVFRVFVDGQQRFDSGPLRAADAPRPVRVSLAGAQELRLEANDAGDGITCDMADWAEARLTPVAGQSHGPIQSVDMARFARVVTWDPHRLDGARAGRIEEFRAEDLFLETDLQREADGCYRVPTSPDGLGCIGLQWLNRRALKALVLECAPPALLPTTNGLQVQGWFGESAWQGRWKALAGRWQVSGRRLIFVLAPKAGAVQTQKVRWVVPGAGQIRVHNLSAFTRSRWDTLRLRMEAEGQARRGRGELRVYNGELLRPKPASEASPSGSDSEPKSPGEANDAILWNLKEPLTVNVRYSRHSSLKSDPTVLRFQLPSGAVGVAVEDLLNNDCVYLPDFGLFVTRDPAPVSLAEYKRRIAARKTILQQVRALPDQTLAQAMKRTHHLAQHEGPVMLSLACDNTKFVLERDGTLRFPARTNAGDDWFAGAGEVRPQFGAGPAGDFTRALDGGWLPIPLITGVKNGLLWRERVFVAPADEPGSNPARLNRPCVCIAEFTVSNSQPVAVTTELTLDFLTNSPAGRPAVLPTDAGTVFTLGPGGLKGMLRISAPPELQFRTVGGEAGLAGSLPPSGTACLTVCLADSSVELPRLTSRLEQMRQATAAYWNAVLAPGMQVETPEPLLNNLIRSSQVRCLIAGRNEAGGDRIAPWIAAMSYGPLESEANSVVRGMAFMGHEEFARRSLDFFIHRYDTNGFLTTGYTLFGTPWHLWTLSEYYQLYGDTNWLRRVAPETRRVGEWMIRQTEKTRRNEPGRIVAPPPGARNYSSAQSPRQRRADLELCVPESGLMPPGVLADWNAFAFHYTMNAYCYAALRSLATALTELRDPSSRRFGVAADELRANLLRAYRWTQSQAPALPLRNGTWIPHYPSQVHSPGPLADFFPGQDGGRSWCYDVELGAHQLAPAGVLDPRGREMERIMDHMEDAQFLSEGWFDYPASANEQDWFNLGGFSKVQPYYTRNCEVYALRDEVKPFVRSYFNTLAAMLNPEVMTFWEHFHHCGAWDKTHETGYFLQQTRTMLVTERGDQLWLAPLITTNWLANGNRLIVSNAPTRFGRVSFCLESRADQGLIAATVYPPGRRPPGAIVLRLLHPAGRPIRSVLLNGKRTSTFDRPGSLVRLKPGGQRLDLQVFYGPLRPSP